MRNLRTKFISAELAYKAVSSADISGGSQINATLQLALKNLEEVPPANVRNNEYAKKEIHGNGSSAWFCCSECGKKVGLEDRFCKYCGNCFQPKE